MKFWISYSSEHLSTEPDFIFWEISLYICIFTILCLNFLRGLVQHIEHKNQLSRSNFLTLKILLCSISFWQKMNNTLRVFRYLFLKFMPKLTKEMKSKITSFLTSNTGKNRILYSHIHAYFILLIQKWNDINCSPYIQ